MEELPRGNWRDLNRPRDRQAFDPRGQIYVFTLLKLSNWGERRRDKGIGYRIEYCTWTKKISHLENQFNKLRRTIVRGRFIDVCAGEFTL